MGKTFRCERRIVIERMKKEDEKENKWEKRKKSKLKRLANERIKREIER